MSQKFGNTALIVMSVIALFFAVSTIYLLWQMRNTARVTPTYKDAMCYVRDENTSVPAASDPNVGSGYSKIIRKGIKDYNSALGACSKDDFDQLIASYCSQNKKHFTVEVALLNTFGGVETHGCPFGCGLAACPTQ